LEDDQEEELERDEQGEEETDPNNAEGGEDE
jgi:hypothetical protein